MIRSAALIMILTLIAVSAFAQGLPSSGSDQGSGLPASSPPTSGAAEESAVQGSSSSTSVKTPQSQATGSTATAPGAAAPTGASAYGTSGGVSRVQDPYGTLGAGSSYGTSAGSPPTPEPTRSGPGRPYNPYPYGMPR